MMRRMSWSGCLHLSERYCSLLKLLDSHRNYYLEDVWLMILIVKQCFYSLMIVSMDLLGYSDDHVLGPCEKSSLFPELWYKLHQCRSSGAAVWGLPGGWHHHPPEHSWWPHVLHRARADPWGEWVFPEGTVWWRLLWRFDSSHVVLSMQCLFRLCAVVCVVCNTHVLKQFISKLC